MNTLLNQDTFIIIIQLIICISIMALFLSIFLDFMIYSRDESVTKEKKSIVETGTMTLFFFAFYLILTAGKGVFTIYTPQVKTLLIICGTLAILTGCIINILGRFNLGSNWANQIKIYKEHTLVQKGMYRIVRHPLYSSIMMMFYGACLVYRNIIAFAAVTFIFIPFMYYRAKQEERLLLQTFNEYREYKNKTGMFFPKIISSKAIRRKE